jgi:hypothetical protein
MCLRRFWDLLERSHEASISVNVRPSACAALLFVPPPLPSSSSSPLIIQVSSASGGICSVEFAVQAKSAKGNQQLGASWLAQFTHQNCVSFFTLFSVSAGDASGTLHVLEVPVPPPYA